MVHLGGILIYCSNTARDLQICTFEGALHQCAHFMAYESAFVKKN